MLIIINPKKKLPSSIFNDLYILLKIHKAHNKINLRVKNYCRPVPSCSFLCQTMVAISYTKGIVLFQWQKFNQYDQAHPVIYCVVKIASSVLASFPVSYYNSINITLGPVIKMQ